MSMVSYFNPAAVYRHQQAMSGQPGQMHHPGSWYGGPGYHQGQVPGAGGYCMQEEQNLWHHPHHGAIFHQEFGPEFQLPAQHHGGQGFEQLPSPPITVSGSELSSPGGGGHSGNASPGNAPAGTRPPPVRSPFEWMKKTAFQSQPNSANKTRTKDKYRVVYTDYQRIELEKEFSLINKYISIRRKSELALNLGLSERQIKIWFQNRRAKERKLLKKRLEESPKDEDPISQMQQFEQKMQMMQNNQHCGQMGQGQMTPIGLLTPDYASLRTAVPN